VCGAGSGISTVMRDQIKQAIEAGAQRRRDEEKHAQDMFASLQKGLERSMHEVDRIKDLARPGDAPLLATGPLNRKVQKLVKRQWIDVPFMDITSGCTFRMFEENGTPVVDAKGHHEWIAACKPFMRDGVARINVYKEAGE